MNAPLEPDPHVSSRIQFGTELRKSRLIAGFTQRRLGEAIHLSISQLSMVENGHRLPILNRKPGTTAEETEEDVAARMERQEILRKPTPPMLWVILDEGVLHRPIAEPEVMKGQFERLLEAGESPRIFLQILPYSARNVLGLLGGFTIADSSRGHHPVAYIDSQSTEDRVSDRPEDLKNLAFLHDAIRADALPRRESLSMIKETIRRCTT